VQGLLLCYPERLGIGILTLLADLESLFPYMISTGTSWSPICRVLTSTPWTQV